MSLLTMFTQVCPRIGLSVPNAVVTSQDSQIIDLLALANAEGEDLRGRYPWSAIVQESTFVTVAAESQGAITTVAGASFDYILNQTIWDRTLLRPVFGTLTPAQWQQLKAQNVTGPWNQFRIRGGNLLFIPAPSAGDTCAFEWVSKNFCQSSGGTGQSVWTADTDTGLLSEDLMKLGLIWRWKAANSLEYAQDFDTYEGRVADAMARDGGKQILSLDGYAAGIAPVVVIPSGSWTG